MMGQVSPRAWCCLCALLVIVKPLAAAADEKRVCANAYERAQELRRGGSLRASREQLVVCARDRCPDFTRVDCMKWLREIDEDTPSLVVRAQSAGGLDVPDVRVFLDGVLLTTRLDGRPVAVDPGPHTIGVEREEGAPIVEQRLVVLMGEKNRIVSVTFPEGPRSPTPPAPPPDAARSAGEARPFPAFAAVLAGTGILAAGVSAYFEVQGISDRRHLFDTCAGHCSSADVNFAYRELRAGDVAGGIALVALGGALWLFLGRPQKTSGIAPRALRGVGEF
jgi:hypothetical protein